MPSRAELELRAGNVGVDPANYPNDSNLEQKTIYEEKLATAATGIKASGTVTVSGQPATTGTVTIGSKTYTFKTTLSGVRATGTLTSDATAPSDGDTVTIGSTVYTFKTTLTPTAFEVLIGASAAAALDNLKSAINLTAGGGTTYAAATTIHPTVRATTNTDTTQVVEAKLAGTAGNSIATTEAGTHTSWGAATLAGGVASVANEVLIGVDAATTLDNLKLAVNATPAATEYSEEYSTGTTANATAEATTNTDTTQLIVARTAGDAGNSIVFTEAATNLTIDGSGTLAGGTDSTVTSSKAYQVSGGADV